MSILLAAKRQNQKASNAFEASQGLGIEREGQRVSIWLPWLAGLPLCLLLGAAANYGWHWWYNKPVEQKVEIREETPLPYRLAANQYEFSTVPLPEASIADAPVVQTVAPKPKTRAAPADPLASMDLNGVSPALAKRFMQAVHATPDAQGEAAAGDDIPAVPDSAPPAAASLADLPASVSNQVPALRYSSHVYSSTAPNRLITLNGHDYHEGDEVAPGIKLLQIQPNDSIFRVGSQSFSLPALTDWRGVQ